MTPCVSVVIPVYGVERYIERCARSLFEQTMQEGIEYVFVDDCSPDKSIVILKDVLLNYPYRAKQVKIISHIENQGSGGTRKTGVENATGEYIIHCDSDDWVEPDMYEILYNTAKLNDADIVGCDFFMDYGTETLISEEFLPKNNIQCLKDMLSGKLYMSMWNKMIKKSVYEIAQNDGCEIFPIGINMWEDVLCMSELVYYSNRISYVHRALYHYQQINNNSYSRTRDYSSWNSMQNTIKCLEDFFKIKSSDLLHRLNYKKIMIKFDLLFYNPIERNKFCHIYPEANKQILSCNVYPFHWRIALLCASYGILFLFNFMTFIKVYLNKGK